MNKLVIFSAAWCGPCKSMAPAVDQLKEQYPDNVVKYDVDAEVDLRDQYQVRAVPTIIVEDASGKEISRKTGTQTKAALEALILE